MSWSIYPRCMLHSLRCGDSTTKHYCNMNKLFYCYKSRYKKWHNYLILFRASGAILFSIIFISIFTKNVYNLLIFVYQFFYLIFLTVELVKKSFQFIWKDYRDFNKFLVNPLRIFFAFILLLGKVTIQTLIFF